MAPETPPVEHAPENDSPQHPAGKLFQAGNLFTTADLRIRRKRAYREKGELLPAVRDRDNLVIAVYVSLLDRQQKHPTDDQVKELVTARERLETKHRVRSLVRDVKDVTILGRDVITGSKGKYFAGKESYCMALDWRGGDLSYAYFSNAVLVGTDFRNADLSYANLHGADCRGCDFRGADLSHALVSRTTNFERANLDGAKLPELYHQVERLKKIQNT